MNRCGIYQLLKCSVLAVQGGPLQAKQYSAQAVPCTGGTVLRQYSALADMVDPCTHSSVHSKNTRCVQAAG